MKGLRRHVQSLLKGRRPRPFPASEADADVLRVAVALRAARPGSGAPREEFVTDLHRRLAREQSERTEQIKHRPVQARRRLLLGGAVAATGAAAAGTAGAAIEHAISQHTPPQAGGTMQPNHGAWHPVVASAELSEGVVHAFDTGSITGFVTRTNGRLCAVSGVCTHQGCRLHLEAGTQLRCPCHQALFALDGAVLRHHLPTRIAALPQLAVREVGGFVQVYVASS